MSTGLRSGERKTEVKKMYTLKFLSTFSVIAFAISTSLMARDIEVIDGNLKYSLKAQKDLLFYQAQNTTLSIAKKDCNAHIIDGFNKRLDRLLKYPFLQVNKPGFIQVKVDGVVGFEPRFGDRAVFLLTMNEKIKKSVIEDQLNCAK